MNLGFTVYGRLQTVLKFPTGQPSPFLTFLPLRGNERAVHPPQSQLIIQKLKAKSGLRWKVSAGLRPCCDKVSSLAPIRGQ